MPKIEGKVAIIHDNIIMLSKLYRTIMQFLCGYSYQLLVAVVRKYVTSVVRVGPAIIMYVSRDF